MDAPMENASPSGGRGVEVRVWVGMAVGVSVRVGVRVAVTEAVAVGEEALCRKSGKGKNGAGLLESQLNNKDRTISAETTKKPTASRVAFLRRKE
jgi:hypothetical protein